MSEIVTLSTKQRKAITALISHGNISQAAEETKISRQTLYRWLSEPGFKSVLKDATKESLHSLSRRLLAMGDKAAQTLDDLLNDENASDNIKLRASEIITNRIMQIWEIVETEDRLETVENELKKLLEGKKEGTK